MKKIKQYVHLAIAGAWISAVSLFSITIINRLPNGTENRAASNLIGALFWGGLIFELIMLWKSNAERKQAETANSDMQCTGRYRIGMISFLKTPAGKISDFLLVIAVLVFAALLLLKIYVDWAVLLSLSVLYLSFHLHCFYNGRNYRFMIADFDKRGEEKNAK